MSVPGDLIVDILTKLPVKSLLRFKCVCNSWYDLIKSTDFINMHLKHQYYSTNNNDCILLMHDPLNDPNLSGVRLSFRTYDSRIISADIEVPNLFRRGVNLSWPCNGLVCLSDTHDDIVVCNPAMREFKYLPTCNYICRAIGLGFDSNTSDYKVVAFVSNIDDDGRNCEVAVYNLSTNSWRKIDCNFSRVIPCALALQGTPLNGALHWIAWRDESYFIISFDMSTEVFHDIKIPSDLEDDDFIFNILTVLNGSLALIAYYDPELVDDEQFVDIWVMQEYGNPESWSKLASIEHLTRMSWKIDDMLIQHLYGELLWCFLDTYKITGFGKLGVDVPKVMVYKESLISIN